MNTFHAFSKLVRSLVIEQFNRFETVSLSPFLEFHNISANTTWSTRDVVIITGLSYCFVDTSSLVNTNQSNRRVTRWPLQSEVLTDNIDFSGLAIDGEGTLHVTVDNEDATDISDYNNPHGIHYQKNAKIADISINQLSSCDSEKTTKYHKKPTFR